jgi:NitT/TauT family transport system permease protein
LAESFILIAVPGGTKRPKIGRVVPNYYFSFASVALVGTLWSIASLSGYLRESVVPSPWLIAITGYRLIVEGYSGSTLQSHLLVSLERFGGGFALAVAFGIPIGLLMAWSTFFRHAIAPFFETFRFVAPLAWVPFAALWFGAGIGGPLLIVFSGAFAACVMNTFRGAQLVDGSLVEASRMLCASPWRIVVDVLMPGSVPAILSGLRVSAALAWQSLIGAELIAATSGVGYLIVQGQGSLRTPVVFTGMAVIGLIGALIDFFLKLLSDRLGRRYGSFKS